MLRFDGLVAVITGAGRGLGREHALLLASRGCRVVVNDLGVQMAGAPADEDPAAEVVREIAAAGGTAVADRHNVVTEARAIIDTALGAFGRLDILINNAGTLDSAPLDISDPKAWGDLLDVHCRGTSGMCREAWPHLASSGHGRIVNTSSSAMFGEPQLTAYCSAKAAIFGFTRSLAFEGRDARVNVNAIMPAAWTRMTQRMEDPRIASVLETHFRSDRISPIVAWLAHPSTAITGEIFRCSGGRAARVVTASTDQIQAGDDTPEAWAAQAEALMADRPIFELRSTFDSFVREITDAEPALSGRISGTAGVFQFDDEG